MAQSDSGNGGGIAVLAFIVGGLIVLVAIVGFMMYSGGSVPGGDELNVEISAPEMPDIQAPEIDIPGEG